MKRYCESEEMYLETILLLSKKHGAVRSVRIAEELGYSRASVSRGVNLLAKKGYITFGQNGEINFTPEGRKKAESIYERHTVITVLLERAGASREIAEENACRIEHVISDDLFEVLKNFAK